MLRAKKYLLGIVILLTFIFVVFVISKFYPRPTSGQIWGVSYDPVHARYLGLNVEDGFAKLITDYKFRDFRIPLHWDAVEPAKDQFNFEVYDNLIKVARDNEVKVILAIGQKTPRWPECHMPAWAKELMAPDKNGQNSLTNYTRALENYISTVVNRYKNNQTVEMWQVENEPFFKFGDCPEYSVDQLNSEIALVKKLDPARSVIITDSGELSTWHKTVNVTDYFGTTLYRVVWNKYIGYFSYDWLPAWFYRAKLALFGRDRAHAFVVELQAEPWIPGKDPKTIPLSEHYKSMDLARLQKNIAYARQVGFDRNYLWGAEWWLWLEGQGIMDIPDFVKSLQK